MSKNKSAKRRKDRRDKLDKKYNPNPKGKRKKAQPVVRGNMEYDSMNALCKSMGVSHGEIFCGYLRQPINYSFLDSTITGYCHLDTKGYHECSYKVPVEGCVYDTCSYYQHRFGHPNPQISTSDEAPSKLEKTLEK